jgi:phytol kinase
MLVCGGDGLAALMGRRYGKIKLPWNKNKSWAGSLGVFLGGWVLSAFILVVFAAAGVFQAPFTSYLRGITLVSLAGALVESLPLEDVDNLTVTLAALVLGPLVF